jgi:hypothetical protein
MAFSYPRDLSSIKGPSSKQPDAHFPPEAHFPQISFRISDWDSPICVREGCVDLGKLSTVNNDSGRKGKGMIPGPCYV